jgi:hypothetical protein
MTHWRARRGPAADSPRGPVPGRCTRVARQVLPRGRTPGKRGLTPLRLRPKSRTGWLVVPGAMPMKRDCGVRAGRMNPVPADGFSLHWNHGQASTNAEKPNAHVCCFLLSCPIAPRTLHRSTRALSRTPTCPLPVKSALSTVSPCLRQRKPNTHRPYSGTIRA